MPDMEWAVESGNRDRIFSAVAVILLRVAKVGMTQVSSGLTSVRIVC